MMSPAASLRPLSRPRPFARLAFVAVTGGGILEQVMRALARLPIRDSIDWSRVSLWWADERFVPADSDDRNDKAAFAALFDQVALDPANIHRMPASDGPMRRRSSMPLRPAYAADLARAAVATQDGEDAASDIPRFDVILLGIGPDGHCASLFPGHPATHETATSVVAVRELAQAAAEPAVVHLPRPRLGQRGVVHRLRHRQGRRGGAGAAPGPAREQVPSAGPRGHYRTLWLVDTDAVSELPPSSLHPTADASRPAAMT